MNHSTQHLACAPGMTQDHGSWCILLAYCQVAQLIEAALIALGSQHADLSKCFLGACVILMHDCHGVDEVMALINKWSESMSDPSLLRYVTAGKVVFSILMLAYSPEGWM